MSKPFLKVKRNSGLLASGRQGSVAISRTGMVYLVEVLGDELEMGLGCRGIP